MFFDEHGAFPDTCRDLIRSLRAAAIEHVFVGAVAMKAYGCEHAEDRIEVCVRRPDIEKFRGEFSGREFQPLPGQSLRYYHPQTQLQIELLIAGEIAGDRFRQQEIRLPDPSEAEYVEGIPVPSLARLIELKLASWDERDRQDVAVLIDSNGLNASFSELLHPVFRGGYAECLDTAAARLSTKAKDTLAL
jgi:hypothetical protein